MPEYTSETTCSMVSVLEVEDELLDVVHRGGNDEISFWMKKRGHDVVRVTCQDGHAVARRVVPHPNCFIV